MDKKESSLGSVEPVLFKAKDPFLRIWKDIGPIISLEVMKQTTLTIAGDGDERRAPTPKKRAPPQKRKKGIKMPSYAAIAPQNPKGKGKSIFLYRRRS